MVADVNDKGAPVEKVRRKIAPEVVRLRGQVGMAVARGRPDEELQYRTELKALLLEQRIKEALTTSPPLPESTRAKLAALLVGEVE